MISRRSFLCGTAAAAIGAGASMGLAYASEADESEAGSSESEASSETSTASFVPGTYTATSTGKNGDVTVSATFSESRISSVVVLEHSESSGISDRAIQELPQRIVDAQTVEVDSVSGATLTSLAIIAAVEDCAEQAGALEALSTELPEPESATIELEADVVVVGAGGAGLVAAIEALSEDKSVIVVEKQADTGGSTRLNGAMFITPADEDELETTTALSEDELVQLYTTYGGDCPNFDEEMVADFVASMEDNLEYLNEYAYHPYRYLYPGWLPLDPTDEDAEAIHVIITEPKLAETPSSDSTWSEDDDGGWPDGIGWKFTNPLTSKVRELGGTILLGAEVEELLMDSGSMSGVVAQGTNGITYQISAPAVVLASGGFGGNADLREEYWGSSTYQYAGTPADDGAVILMAEELGAAVDYVETEGSEDSALYDSVGGVLIDSYAHVLDTSDEPIPGLYAAGEIADMRFLGTVYPICGSFNQWSIYTGRKAGANAASLA